MYFMENGIRQDVVVARDEDTEEYGYVIICSDCGNMQFMPECIFLDFIEECGIELVVEKVDDEDDDKMCECPYCQGFRDGIEASMDAMEVLDECGCECGECCEVCEPEEFTSNVYNINIENLILEGVSNPKEFIDGLTSFLKMYSRNSR